MAKNITIAEGGVGRNFGPTKKLETDLQGVGTQLWIPEDEANDYATKTPLTITENGEYTPAEGGFNPVNVDVHITGTFGSLSVTENGQYDAADEGLTGYSEIRVAVSDPVALTPGTITTNGTHSPPAGFDGFSSVRVEVPLEGVTVDSGGGVIINSLGGNTTTVNPDGSITVETSQGNITVDQDGTITGGGT